MTTTPPQKDEMNEITAKVIVDDFEKYYPADRTTYGIPMNKWTQYSKAKGVLIGVASERAKAEHWIEEFKSCKRWKAGDGVCCQCAEAFVYGTTKKAEKDSLVEAAERMVAWIEREKHPHLIDNDENPGQALREALADYYEQSESVSDSEHKASGNADSKEGGK